MQALMQGKKGRKPKETHRQRKAPKAPLEEIKKAYMRRDAQDSMSESKP